LHPHWLFFSGPVAMLTASLIVAVVLAANGANEYLQLAAACVALSTVGWLIGRSGRWATTYLAVTTQRVIFRTGVLRKDGLELPLSRVQSVRARQSIGDRLFRSGDVLVEAVDGGERSFACVPHPKLVQQEIYRRAQLIAQA